MLVIGVPIGGFGLSILIMKEQGIDFSNCFNFQKNSLVIFFVSILDDLN